MLLWTAYISMSKAIWKPRCTLEVAEEAGETGWNTTLNFTQNIVCYLDF